MIGRTLSRYRITAEISRGGMGIVYRATDQRLGREVALKVLTPSLLGNAEVRRRFLQEARAAAALQHPAIAVVHEIDEVDDVTFIAMELVRGDRLGDVLARDELDLAERLELAIEVADGLAEAHRKGVVHRDLKPANVLVNTEGHAKLVDFGLAKLTDPLGELSGQVDTFAREETDPGRLLGTAAYMSPEQAKGGTIDPRSDIFSFGSVLYEVLTGKPAFRRETAVDTLHAVLRQAAPPLGELGPGAGHVREPLQRLLDGCLAKAPSERTASMKDVASALRAILRRLERDDAEAPAPPAVTTQAPPARAGAPDAKLRVAIVDDEDLARRVLREYLGQHPDVEVVAECRNGFEAVKAAAEVRPDLLLLDVQMPKLTGFEVLELLDRGIGVIFVTAYDEFALKAFDVHAIDYVLKPVSPERLAQALDRARQRLRTAAPAPVAELMSAVRAEAGPAERILVRQGGRVQVIPVETLDYAQAQDDYVSLRVAGREVLKEQTLAELERTLDPKRFVRIHRSYLLNVERLDRVEPYAKDSRVAILRDGTRLPVSRAGHTRLKGVL